MAIKTLHLTNAYHPTSGGIRTFYEALLTHANETRRPMRLLVPGVQDALEDRGEYGRLYTFAANPAPCFDRRYRLLLPWHYFPVPSSAMGRVIAEERPDVVEVCDKYGLPYLAALLRKGWLPGLPRPTLVGLSCERMDDNVAAYVAGGRRLDWFAKAYIRYLYGPPFDAHLANSEYTADELRQALWDRAPDFIRVCPMGVSFQEFGPAWRDTALRRRVLVDTGGTAASVLLLYAGRLSPEKNLSLLIDMMVHLASAAASDGRDYRLVLAGEGPLAASLARDASDRVPGLVHQLGAVTDRRHLAALYASCDAFVHANPREPFGIAPLEAMASFVPVVAPAQGGVLSYANASNACLAAPDGRSFAHAVRRAVLQPDPARLAAARETARRHDWSEIAARYFATLDAIHEGAAARGHDALTRTQRWPSPFTRNPGTSTTRSPA